MKSFFFNAEPTSDVATHPTGFDREYDADDYAAFFAPFFSKAGVMPRKDANACLVEVQEGNTLKVNAGYVFVKGRMCQFEGDETITVATDCHVCARMNKTADVRSFQLVAVETPVQTEDIYDLALASVAITPVTGGYAAVVTDERTFLEYMGQPAYYPPSSEDLPYVLWLYTLGFPMTSEQRRTVTENPSLMAIFKNSVGAGKAAMVEFTKAEWTASGENKVLTIPYSKHGRSNEIFTHRIQMLKSDGAYSETTWGVLETKVGYDAATGNITLTAPDGYSGKVIFAG